MTRLIAYWGDRGRPVTTALGDSEIAFAGISRKIYETFQLPWIGEQAAESQLKNETPPPTDADPDDTPTIMPLDAGDDIVKRDGPSRSGAKPRSTPAPPARGPAVKKTDLQRLRDQLQLWKEKGDLPDLSTWNRVLHHLVHATEPSAVSLDRHSFDKLFTEERVKLEGTGSIRRQSFWVPRADWVIRGLDAYQTLQLEKQLTVSETESYRRSLATMQRQLAYEIRAYASQRLGVGAEGERWEPAVTCAQILLARAWLRGMITPDAPLSRQLQAILSDEDGPDSDPLSRTTNWQAFLNKTKNHHGALRSALRDMLSLPQGESHNFGLADLSKIASRIILFRTTLRFTPWPKDTDSGIDLFETMKDIVDSVDGTLRPLLRFEQERLNNQAESLAGLLRGYGIKAHIARLETVIDTVATHVPGASPDLVKKWKAQYDRIRSRLDTDAPKAVQAFMVEAADLKAENKVLSLRNAVTAPSRDLAQFREFALDGENLAVALLDYVKDNFDLMADTGRLEKIRDFGRSLANIGRQEEEAR
ncbi:hypothetical protein GR211_33330 [Rhizobium leguminosarum]|uniref:hypothetical protein n=1 Tax=Rhizobium ruizarguesonis TaxID=2081791 RepID=UPI0013B752DD|nr:hypothetical protein [Rhizobium ruizarguesonis]NEJ17732.1 hypothetical protein [Rhizobium ruizarguesonis]NEK31710.1 hypothetical protein [Rhizobium ruizarguesonis]